MATRLTNDKKNIINSNYNDIKNEFELEISELVPNFFENQTKVKVKEKEEEDNGENDEDNNDSDDDSPNFRDKDKELKNLIKSQLSLESQDVINMNDDEFNAIIEQLKKKGVSKDKGLELQKIRNIVKNNRISR